ncbi:MAG: hypothetical protein K2L14_01460 [Duncaniella sp.]|nr:hypothetical protein [Duncaniella sp.]
MPRLIAILFTLFPVLFASGAAASAVKFGGGITASDVGTVLRTVSPAQGRMVLSSLPSAQMLSATYYDAVPAYLGVICSRSDVLAAPAGLVTAQVDRVLGSSVRSRVYTVNFYDKLERVVFSQSAVADNSLLKTTTTYDFAGNPSSVSTTSYIGNNTFTDTYTYGYDHLNRPTTISLRHGDKTYPLISNTYDNLGRLRSNGAPGKAAATFGYDMRSALSSINSYHFIQNIYRGNGNSKFLSKSGRITKNDIRLTGRHLTFDYQYDLAGRLTKAAAVLENTGVDYTEEFDYDLNTNIIGLRRYGAKNATTGALLDDLTMTYEGNQLRYITDDATDYPYEASLDFRAKAPIESTPGASVAAPFGLIGGLNPIDTTITKPGSGTLKPSPDPVFNYSADYAYDANGNMTQDRHSSITSIAYNVLNLPQTVTYEGTLANRPVSQMVYDASGRKHIVRNGATVLSKFRGDETRYIGDYIMVNDTIDRLQTPYGYLRDGVFHSYVFDYQGNVMAVVAGNDVTQTNLYYADGLPMNTSTNPTANAFKYTAKELSLFRGLPVYDYTARHTLPQINRFRTMDPLAERFYWLSPYNFCNGDPVNYKDTDGQMCIFINGYDRGDGGKSEYWNGLDHKIMNKIQDTKAKYFDGSPAKGRWHGLKKNISADRRERLGREKARENADNILNNLDFENGETIKIFTHSMGAKFAKGFADELLNIALDRNLIDDKESQNIIEYEVDMAPFQPKQQEAVEGVNTIAIHHDGDLLAGTKDIKNCINLTHDKGGFWAHSINTFSINEIYSAICYLLLYNSVLK